MWLRSRPTFGARKKGKPGISKIVGDVPSVNKRIYLTVKIRWPVFLIIAFEGLQKHTRQP